MQKGLAVLRRPNRTESYDHQNCQGHRRNCGNCSPGFVRGNSDRTAASHHDYSRVNRGSSFTEHERDALSLTRKNGTLDDCRSGTECYCDAIANAAPPASRGPAGTADWHLHPLGVSRLRAHLSNGKAGCAAESLSVFTV